LRFLLGGCDLAVLGIGDQGIEVDQDQQAFVDLADSLSFVLANVRFSPVGITRIGAFGDFTQTNNCGVSLPALASCAIAVTSRPKFLAIAACG